MTHDDMELIAPVALLGASSGARSMLGIAAVARARAGAETRAEPQSEALSIAPRLVQRANRAFDQKIAMATALMAAGEMIADKSPNIPDRTNPGSLVARTVAGAIVGAAVAQYAGRDKSNLAAVGAVSAFVGTHLSYHARQALNEILPDLLAAAVEDAVALSVAAGGVRLLEKAVSRQA